MQLILLLIPWLFGLGLAQSWRLAQSQSTIRTTTLHEGSAWRYTLSPVGEEAKALWEELSPQYQALLRAGHRVDLGRWRLYFLGGSLRFEPHCPKATLPCFTLAGVAYEPLRLGGFFHELDTLLGRALSEAQKKPRASLTLIRLVRLELEEGRIKAVKPSGWKP
ncbi:MAG: hypothetical protein C4300_04500 [Thermus sp.]